MELITGMHSNPDNLAGYFRLQSHLCSGECCCSRTEERMASDGDCHAPCKAVALSVQDHILCISFCQLPSVFFPFWRDVKARGDCNKIHQ